MNQYVPGRTQLKLNRLAIAVALALPVLAHAEAAQPEAVLPQVQVTGAKSDDTEGLYTTRNTRTATPLDLSLRDTPQAVTVITQQRIEDQGLQTITDVVNNATGVSANRYESHRATFNARGFSINNLQIDGVPTTWDQQWSGGEILSSLALYDRVEIVRGATGLMTGAGNPSAAINLVRKRASSKQLTGSADVSVGNWSDRRASVDVSTPLTQSGNVRARVVGELHKSDSWVNRQTSDDKTFYATVEADLTPRTLLSAGFSHQKTDPKSPMWGGLPYFYTDGTAANWDRSTTTSANWSHWASTYDNSFASLEHRFDNGWKVQASYAHSDRESDSYLLYLSGTPNRTTGLGLGAFAGSYLTETRQDDANLQVSGPFQLGGRTHEAAFGYMHSKQKFTSNSRAANFGTADASVGNFNNYNPAAYPTPTWGPLSFYSRNDTTQDALYGVARFSLADPLKLIVGARVTDYERNYLIGTVASQIKNDHEVTPYAGLVYAINQTYSAYASYTEIFQPQNMIDINRKSLDPIKGKNAEAGIKAEFLDGRVNASFSLFKIKQDNLAQKAGEFPGTIESYYTTVDGATSKGFDTDVSGQLARGWNASAGYTHYSAQDAAGKPFNTIYPRDLLRVFTTYDLSGALAGVTVGGGVNWQGQNYTVAPVGGRIQQDSFALVNLMARYEINQNWSAQVNVNNLTDKTSFGMNANSNQITYAAPRSYSATLKYRF